MLGQIIKQSFKPNSLVFNLVVAGFIGLLLGIACQWFSPLWTLVAVIGGGFVFVALMRPELALLGILVVTSSIIFEDRLPLIPIGIGSLHVSDVILLEMLGLIVVRWLVEPDFKIIHTSLDWPLLIFYGVALLSTINGVFQSTVDPRLALRGIRVMTYYLTFFIVTNLVREDHQLTFLRRGLYLLATIVAMVMVAQFFLGESVSILPGRVETLKTQEVIYKGVTRIVTPGRSLLLVMFINATVILVFEKFRSINVLKFLQWSLFGIALIFTFLRSYWVVIGVVLLLLASLIESQTRRRLILWGLAVLLVATIVLLSIFSEPESQIARAVSATFIRFSTLGSSTTLTESSLQQRFIENEYALNQILSNPLIGLGLRAIYRPLDPRIDFGVNNAVESDPRIHIHNGHLLIMVNTGVLGYLSFMWLSLSYLVRGFKHWRVIPDTKMRANVLGFTLAYVGILIAAVVNSVFMHWFWTPVIGIILGVNEVILRKDNQEGHGFGGESWQDARKET